MRAFDSSHPHSDSPSIWLGDAPSLADDDPMAQVLPWLVQHLGMSEALAAGTGLDDAASRERPGQLLGALQQLGFDTRLNHGPVTALQTGDLPAVLRLRTGDACVLVALQDVPGGLRRCQVVVLTPEPMAFTVTDADLARECAGPALLIRRPPARPAVRAEPARGLSALAQALAERRAAQRAPAAPATPGSAVDLRDPPSLRDAHDLQTLQDAQDLRHADNSLPHGAHGMAHRPRAAVIPAPVVRSVSRSPMPDLPTLDDVIEADELAELMARAAQPMLADALEAARLAPAFEPEPEPAPRQAPEPAAAQQAAAPPPWPRPRPQAPRALVLDLSLDEGPPAPVVPVAAPESAPARLADPLTPDAPSPTAAPPDAAVDVVLDLGFLDRQTGAGRLRSQLGRWRHRLRSQLQAMAGDWPLPGVPRAARPAPPTRLPRRRAEPAPAAAVPAARRPGGAAAAASGSASCRLLAGHPGGSSGDRSGERPGERPGHAAGGAWRPRFGLAWPLGHAPTLTPAANAAATALPERREPTLEPPWPDAGAPPSAHAAWHDSAVRPGAASPPGAADASHAARRTVPSDALPWPADLAWVDDTDAPHQTALAPPGARRPGRAALDPDLMYEPMDPPAAQARHRAPDRQAARQADPYAGLHTGPQPGRGTQRPSLRPSDRSSDGYAERTSDRSAGRTSPGTATRRAGLPGWSAAMRTWLSFARQHAARRSAAGPVDGAAAMPGPWARAAARWRSGLPWPGLTGLRQRLQRRRPQLPSAGVLAQRLLHGLAQRSGLARAAAGWRRWRARVAAAPWPRWLEAPLWAACGSVCLIDGLPLAWARMLSVSGLRAAAGMLPGLLRDALAADQDRAAAALAAAAAAPGARRGPAGAPRRAAPGVPLAANAAQLAGHMPQAGHTPQAGGTALAGAALALPAVFTGPSTLAMVAARADKVERARIRGIDVATTLRRRSEAQSMGPPLPARARRAPLRDSSLLAA